MFGNSLVIYVVITNNKMRTPTDVLILNLAVADFLFIIICVPFTAWMYASPLWIFGDAWCKISQYFIYVSACVSIYTLVCMSLARYLAVVHPLSSRPFMTRRNTCFVVLTIWMIILLGCIPHLLQHGVISYTYNGEERKACLNIKHQNDEHARKLFFTMFFSFGYALPLYLMIILYSILLVMLVCRKQQVTTLSKERNLANQRATRMVFVVVFVFMICWLPIQVIFMIQTFGNYTNTVEGIACQMAANCLAYFNSCINPLLYTFLSRQFRKSFKRVLCCCCYRQTEHGSASRMFTQQLSGHPNINEHETEISKI